MADDANVVVVGAGIAGVAAAYFLAVRRDVPDVVIVDPRPPLTLTSDKSTECFRNFWPNRPMVGLMNRSIDLLEELATESEDVFGLSRRGYLFVTGDVDTLAGLAHSAEVSSGFGSGPVRRVSPGAHEPPTDGFDLHPDTATLLEHFPYLSPAAVGGLHVRRAGWLSAQQLGAWMLQRFRENGGRVITDEVASIDIGVGGVEAANLASGARVRTGTLVNAAGPLSPVISDMVGLETPIYSELHLKVAYRDHLGVVPRSAPMIIWSDPQQIDWSEEEREELIAQGREDVIGQMPIFCHGRPEGGPESPYLLSLWEYHKGVVEPRWPVPHDPLYPEVVMRGMTTMVPELGRYLDHLPHSVVDGGYYSKTRENRPLVGPAGPEGFHLMAAMSGFGVMVSAGAADLLAAHITGSPLPWYAGTFLLSRYQDPAYLAEIAALADSGQL